MKNVFIGGVARSGKSTLSKRLHDEFNYNHIPLDYFTSSFKHNFPEIGINSNAIMNESSEKLALLLSRVMTIMDITNELFVIDSAHIKPEDILKYINRDNWEIVYIGYPNADEDYKLKQIRKYDSKDDWTNKKSDEELISILSELIKLSNEIELTCNDKNIQFINVSNDFVNNLKEGYEILTKNVK